MIEYVQFRPGEGLRADQTDWGRHTGYALEHQWAPLRVGKYVLGLSGESLLSPTLLVLSDGRARLTRALHPKAQHYINSEAGAGAMLSSAMLVAAPTRIDEDRNVFPILDGRISEMPHFGTEMSDLVAVRLMGVVRFNPDNYTPTV